MSRYYSDEQKAEIKDQIIEWLSNGQTLRSFCRIEGNPVYSVVYDWKDEDEEFAARFARAREIGFEVINEERLEIADDGTNDYNEKLDAEGNNIGWQLNREHIERSKLRIHTREKLLAVWSPSKFGTKVDHTSSDGSAKPSFSVNIDLSE